MHDAPLKKHVFFLIVVSDYAVAFPTFCTEMYNLDYSMLSFIYLSHFLFCRPDFLRICSSLLVLNL